MALLNCVDCGSDISDLAPSCLRCGRPTAAPQAPARRPETVWRLLDARCEQLADAITAARLPFLLALTWSFIWAWGLYVNEYGYIGIYKERYEGLAELSRQRQSKPEFSTKCCFILPDICDRKKLTFQKLIACRAKCSEAQLTSLQVLTCRKRIKERLTWARSAERDSWYVTLPGGLGKTFISDLSVVGQLGLLLILNWTYFAFRRENHAVRALVDMQTTERRQWSLKAFVLSPTDRLLSAEHLAYAYNAVAQRFMFLLSSHSRPLLAATICMCLLPAAVATWNFITDIRDVILSIGFFEPELKVRVAVECALVGLVWYASQKIIRFANNTSMLLNGWCLAVRDVWMDEWDERTDDSASPVLVDVIAQTARPCLRT